MDISIKCQNYGIKIQNYGIKTHNMSQNVCLNVSVLLKSDRGGFAEDE